MFNVKIHLDLHAYIYILCKLQNVQVNVIEIYLIDSKFYTVYPACDVIKIDLIIKQDDGLDNCRSLFQKQSRLSAPSPVA